MSKLAQGIKAYIKEKLRKEHIEKSEIYRGLIRDGHLRKDSQDYRR